MRRGYGSGYANGMGGMGGMSGMSGLGGYDDMFSSGLGSGYGSSNYGGMGMGMGGSMGPGVNTSNLLVMLGTSMFVAMLVICIFFPQLLPFEVSWNQDKKKK
jgi:hypothetical protein